jgi:hypothetical protein
MLTTLFPEHTITMQLSPVFLTLLAFVISANAGPIPSDASLQAREPLADLTIVEDLYTRELEDELYARDFDLYLDERDVFDDGFQLERRDPPQPPRLSKLPIEGNGIISNEIIDYTMKPNGQQTETIDKTIGGPGRKQEKVEEVFTECVSSSSSSFSPSLLSS